jgi:hypothetical protein
MWPIQWRCLRRRENPQPGVQSDHDDHWDHLGVEGVNGEGEGNSISAVMFVELEAVHVFVVKKECMSLFLVEIGFLRVQSLPNFGAFLQIFEAFFLYGFWKQLFVQSAKSKTVDLWTF